MVTQSETLPVTAPLDGGEITFSELLDRGVADDVTEFMLQLSRRLDRNPHLKPIEGFRLKMHAFGVGQACQCGERGLLPDEERCADPECLEMEE